MENTLDKLGLKKVEPFDKLSETPNLLDNEIQEQEEQVHDEAQGHELGEEERTSGERQEGPESKDQVLSQKEEKEEPSEDAQTEEGKDGEDDLEVETNVEIDDLSPFAEFFKENGYLPDDFEIDEETKFSKTDLDKAILEHKKAELEMELTPEIEQRLMQHGYDPKLAKINRIKSYGVDPNILQDIDYYSRVAQIKLNPDDDAYEDNLMKLGKEFYQLKGESIEDAERLTNSDIDSLDEDKLISRYTEFFKTHSEKLANEVNGIIEEGKEKEKQRQKENIQKINRRLDSGEINGRKYPKEQMDAVRNWMFKRDKIVELEDGRKVKMTGQEKFDYEISQDFDKALEARILLALGSNIEAIAERAEIKGRKSLVDELNKGITTRIKRKQQEQEKENSTSDIYKKLGLRRVQN